MEDANLDSTGKIQCRSRRVVLKIIDIVKSEISKIVDQQEFESEGEKCRYSERFVEIFKSAFLQNILVDGLTWEESILQQEDDCTKEYEPFNKEKFSYLRSVLLPQYDDALTNLTKKRQECPQKCKDALVVKINDDISHMAHAKIVNAEKDDFVQLNDTHGHTVSEESENIRLMGEKLKFPNTLERMENIKSAEAIHKRIKESKTFQLISEVTKDSSLCDNVVFKEYKQEKSVRLKNDSVSSRKKFNETLLTSTMEIS